MDVIKLSFLHSLALSQYSVVFQSLLILSAYPLSHTLKVSAKYSIFLSFQLLYSKLFLIT